MLIFDLKEFKYPYQDIRFPGQHSEEKILFISREGNILPKLRLLFLAFIYITGAVLEIIIFSSIKILDYSFSYLIPWVLLIWTGFGVTIAWWIREISRKSIFIITTRRLTKFTFTTPWSRYQMSVGLDQIVDTGAYQKGLFQMTTGLGYFVARSAAGSVKNFKIYNVQFAEDLHNYVNKLLYAFREHQDKLDNFRPFIPAMKGAAREAYVNQVTPEYSKTKSQE